MKCGYYVSTPKSRLLEECSMRAGLAFYDAMRLGPVAVTPITHWPVQQRGNKAKRRRP